MIKYKKLKKCVVLAAAEKHPFKRHYFIFPTLIYSRSEEDFEYVNAIGVGIWKWVVYLQVNVMKKGSVFVGHNPGTF